MAFITFLLILVMCGTGFVTIGYFMGFEKGRQKGISLSKKRRLLESASNEDLLEEIGSRKIEDFPMLGKGRK
jgi:hypothetical protein